MEVEEEGDNRNLQVSGSVPEEGGVEDSSAISVRRPAWWAWPVILLSLVPFDWFVAPSTSGNDKEGRSDGAPALGDSSDLALLKLQAQVVIASAKLDPAASVSSLDDLADTINGDRMIAALALLEAFLQTDAARVPALLDQFSQEVPEDLAQVTEEAVKSGVGDEEREKLRQYLGWFADLARGPGGSTPPRDSEIRSRSFAVLAIMALALVVVSMALPAGLFLLILHFRKLQAGTTRNLYEPTPSLRHVLLESFALYLGIMSGSALLSVRLGAGVGMAGYGLAVLLPLLWPLLRGVRWRDFRLATGLHRGRGWWREIAAGTVGYLGVLAIASIGIALTLFFTLVGAWVEGLASPGGTGASFGQGGTPGPETHPVVGWIYEGDFWVRLACLGLAAGFAPVFEELFFRGTLQGYFRGRFRFFASALFTGLIFAALHPQGLYAIPALTGIGVGFSLLREWRGSLLAPMVAHAINNGSLVLMLWWLL